MSFIDWNSIGIGCAMTAVAHPFTYTKVLVQLGHEPLPPVMRRNVFFRKKLQYPSVFEYIGHIRKCDGYAGLYRGLMPRVCANASASLTYTIVSNALSPKQDQETPPTGIIDESIILTKVCEKTSKEVVARCAAIIVSQPFHVVAIRTMAQFVGHETFYSNIYTSFVEIYNEDGILGFLSGVVPRLASEIISIWLCNLLSYAVNTYVLTDANELRDLRQYTHMVMGYLAQTATYPLSVTSTVMATNGARIQAGRPPFTPVYKGWLDCLRDLHKQGASNRGSSMIFRKAASHLYAATSVTPVPAPAFS